ncbi:MAG: lysophospholipid acyltransferase family protein [Pirellulales bacterium]
MPDRSFAKRAWYAAMRVVVGFVSFGMFRLRCFHRERFPATGGYLLLSNHQSHLDPPLIGSVVPRRINYLARDTLFKNKFFAWLINSLDAIPIDREGLGLSGLKETMKRLKRGEIVLLFPEGTRSPDGEIQPLKPGFSALVQRTGVPIVPIALDGAYDAWPRNSKFPRPGKICIVVGEPISLETAKSLDDRALVALVDERLRACHAEARARRNS